MKATQRTQADPLHWWTNETRWTLQSWPPCSCRFGLTAGRTSHTPQCDCAGCTRFPRMCCERPAGSISGWNTREARQRRATDLIIDEVFAGRSQYILVLWFIAEKPRMQTSQSTKLVKEKDVHYGWCAYVQHTQSLKERCKEHMFFLLLQILG